MRHSSSHDELKRASLRRVMGGGSHELDNSDAYYSEILCPNCQGSGTEGGKPPTIIPHDGVNFRLLEPNDEETRGSSCLNCHGSGATHGSYPNRPARYIGQYSKVDKYGGPEEGGWWNHDTEHQRSMFIPDQWAAHPEALEKWLRQLNQGQREDWVFGPGEYNQEGTHYTDDRDFWERYESWSPQEQDAWDNDVQPTKTHYRLEHEPGEHHTITLPGMHWDDSGGYLHGAKNDPDYATDPRITDPFLRLPPPPGDAVT